jgi:hypothetical protein
LLSTIIERRRDDVAEALRWPGGWLAAEGAAVAVADVRFEATADIVLLNQNDQWTGT